MVTYLIIGAVYAIINAVVLVTVARLGCGGFIETLVNDVPCYVLVLMFVTIVLLWPVCVVTDIIGLIKEVIRKG